MLPLHTCIIVPVYLTPRPSSAPSSRIMLSKVCHIRPLIVIRELSLHLGTEFWTATNIADGLNALATCIEVNAVMTSCFHNI